VSGNPGKRPLNVDEPKPAIALPDIPRHLVGEARKEWKRITPELLRLGLLSRIDRAALAMYCSEWARYVRAELRMARRDELMNEEGAGERARTPQGYEMQSVDLQISNKAKEACLRFLIEFGMSPASRSRVQVTPQMPLPGLEEAVADWKWSTL
jgi:P27 family predicted phage terminase small subunit